MLQFISLHSNLALLNSSISLGTVIDAVTFCLVSTHPRTCLQNVLCYTNAIVLYNLYYQTLPARTFGEDNVVVIFWTSLNERDARVVLPMPHRLLEQSLVSPCSSTSHNAAWCLCYVASPKVACGQLKLHTCPGADPRGGHGAMAPNTIERLFNVRFLTSFHSYFGIHLLFI